MAPDHIITCTPNPSLDKTLHIKELRPGRLNRATYSRVDPSGKGVNVSLCCAKHSIAATCVLPLGGDTGATMANLLKGTDVRTVPTAGETRSNITLTTPDGTTTKINEPGPKLSTDELNGLLTVVKDAISTETTWVIGSGSLPDQAPIDFYAQLVNVARSAGVQIAIDASGPALEAAVKAAPTLIKPNRSELEQLVKRPIDTLGDALAACETVLETGTETVLATLGRDGALLVTGEGAWYAESPTVRRESTVAAGDSALAGYLSSSGSPEAALVKAVEFGAACVALPGSQTPGPDDVSRVTGRIVAISDGRQLLND